MNHAQLTALGRALRVLGEHGDALSTEMPDAKLHEVKADLKRALDLLEETVTTAAPTTRCAEHPTGPVDEDAADLCLLCETRRRLARRSKVNDSFQDSYQDSYPQSRPAAPGGGERTTSRYGVRGDRPVPQQRWLPEMWTGQTWQLCGTPRRDKQEAELYLAAQRRGPRPSMAYRLVHEFTDYEVLRIWGTPVKIDIEPMGNL
ncbi:hypothetical protein QFZ75_003481 [Streptomyces sp. V3I8]|uniref:hypothetical protein n=1 Tax=Streptomyces sp. V3I8 TaxID=3042279 RepID=UPI00278A9FF6|nr:hypothetical protein [Streptomyces sp. V3I8]MDQ1037065.1 hypothetical protein [Streptomyces sp. V3I8]